MCKQWIPGHFSLLPRGLGTRLGTPILKIPLTKWHTRYMLAAYILLDGTDNMHVTCKYQVVKLKNASNMAWTCMAFFSGYVTKANKTTRCTMPFIWMLLYGHKFDDLPTLILHLSYFEGDFSFTPFQSVSRLIGWECYESHYAPPQASTHNLSSLTLSLTHPASEGEPSLTAESATLSNTIHKIKRQ